MKKPKKVETEVGVPQAFLKRIVATTSDAIVTTKPNQKSRIANTFLYNGEDRVCVGFASDRHVVTEARTMRVVKPEEYGGETFEFDFAPEPFTHDGLIVHLKGEERVLTEPLTFVVDDKAKKKIESPKIDYGKVEPGFMGGQPWG